MKQDDIIFLSASVPYREHWIKGARPVEIEEAIISIARAVFARKGRLLFGGHPSISPLIASVAGEYFAADPRRNARPVVTFQSEYFRGRLPDRTWEMVRMGWSAIEWTPKVAGDGKQTDQDASLDAMRAWMLLAPDTPPAIIERNALKAPLAMIAVGGMEGVRDEAIMFLRGRARWGGARRVYVFKSGGGAAGRLIDPAISPAQLWPDPDRRGPDPRDIETLYEGLTQGDIVDVEKRWFELHGKNLPPLEYQPFAAIAQWLLDAQAHSDH